MENWIGENWICNLPGKQTYLAMFRRSFELEKQPPSTESIKGFTNAVLYYLEFCCVVSFLCHFYTSNLFFLQKTTTFFSPSFYFNPAFTMAFSHKLLINPFLWHVKSLLKFKTKTLIVWRISTDSCLSPGRKIWWTTLTN